MAPRVPILIVGAILLLAPGCGGGEEAESAAPEGEPIELEISGGYPAYTWKLQVPPSGEATVERGGFGRPDQRKSLEIPSEELDAVREQLDRASFETERPRSFCADCLAYVLRYGEEEMRADMLSIPRDLEEPIEALERIGGKAFKTSVAVTVPTR